MDIKNVIETAFIELRNSETPYLMVTDLSLSKKSNDPEITRKIKFILFKSSYFDRHSDHAIILSKLGVEVASKFDTISQYEKSLIKTDYLKIITTIVAVLTFIIVSITFFRDNDKKKLEKELEYKNSVIDSLETNSISNSTTKQKKLQLVRQ